MRRAHKEPIRSAIYRTGQRFGAVHLIDVLRARATERIWEWEHDKRPEAWRLSVAHAQAGPPYVVFLGGTLAAIAEARPASLQALARIGGIGTRKLQRYGAALLDVVASPDAR